jgi:hypothetical protein
MNPFPGVNPHLNSLLQTPGNEDEPSLFASFHATHIVQLADALNTVLPTHYTAYPEQSLQVRGAEWDEVIRVERPRPDVSIFRSGGGVMQPAGVAALPTWEAPLQAAVDLRKRPLGIVIRAAQADASSKLGRVVTRIEMLSPSNKPGGGGSSAYQSRRFEALELGIPLLEIDVIHELPPVLFDHPIYPQDNGSHPYMIIISDPRPDFERGRVRVFGFDIDEKIPALNIPLAGVDTLTFDFNAVYQQTFLSRRYHNLLDYQQTPERFVTYSAAHQAYIRKKMESLAR